MENSRLRFRCPACKSAQEELSKVDSSGWTCPACASVWRSTDGIVHALTNQAREDYEQFFNDCLTIRRGKGRGSSDPAYYLELPFRAGGVSADREWPLRALTWRYFERKVLGPLEEVAGRPLTILDVGAGVGWMSYRLAERGHRPVAVDLLDDPLDGLGAARHYVSKLKEPFPAIQAEMDNLPLADDQFDLVVFNASFHFAVDYRHTLQEARRMLGWGGAVAILDTPVYQHFQQGEQMVEERQAFLAERYGTRSDSVLSMGYLDEGMLAALAKDLNIRWTVHKPWYGLKRHALPLLAKLQGRRPPSRNWLLTGAWVGS